MPDQPKQVDITDPAIPIVELYKMNISERNQADALKAELQKTLMNLVSIEVVIAMREKVNDVRPDSKE